MKRYFHADCDGATRIAIVEATNSDDISDAPESRGAEIDESDLPNDFADWKRYTAHAYAGGSSVEIMSRDGD